MRVRPNDVIVHCGHADSSDYYLVPATGGLEFVREDGTMGTAQWAICCSDCFHDSRGDIQLVEYAFDYMYGSREASATS